VDSIDSVSITWSDGTSTVYADTLPANRFYRIRRFAPVVD
jgi:hypothetical protein